jgi:hypothetical protein
LTIRWLQRLVRGAFSPKASDARKGAVGNDGE